MKIEILNAQNKIEIDENHLKSCARKVLRFSKKKKAHLSIMIVDNNMMKQLNKKYRKKDKAADVLSFSMKEGRQIKGDRELLGDIVISAEEARGENEIYLFLIHGMLHLLGYDHKNRSQTVKMEKRQTDLLEKICKSAAW